MIYDLEIRLHHKSLNDLLFTRDPVAPADVVALAESLRFVLRALDDLYQRLDALERR